MTGHFAIERRVEFCDTDAAGMMHFTAFFDMMEQAEHELLRHLEVGVFMQRPEGTFSWPRVSAKCDFRGPARFEELLHIAVSIDRVGEKSVTYRFRIQRAGVDVAEGLVVAVCCLISPGQPPEPVCIPPEVSRVLREFADR